MIKKIQLVLMAMLMACGTLAHADWLTSPDYPAVSLSSIVDDQIYLVGDKAFSNFNLFQYGVTGGVVDTDLDEIFIQGVFDTETGDYGVKFILDWEAEGPNQRFNAMLSFKVSVTDQDNYIDGVRMALYEAGAGDTGLIAANETAYDESLFVGEIAANLSVSKQEGDGDLSIVDDEMLSTEPLKEIWISKDVSVSSGDSADGFARLSGFYQFYSQVPEPATMSLLAVGAFGLLRRKRQ